MSEYGLTDEEYNGLMPNKEQFESYLKEPDDELAASLSENEKRLVAKFILFGENVAKAAQDKLQSYLVKKIGGMEDGIKFTWRNNQDYKDGIQEGVEACRSAVLKVIKEVQDGRH